MISPECCFRHFRDDWHHLNFSDANSVVKNSTRRGFQHGHEFTISCKILKCRIMGRVVFLGFAIKIWVKQNMIYTLEDGCNCNIT